MINTANILTTLVDQIAASEELRTWLDDNATSLVSNSLKVHLGDSEEPPELPVIVVHGIEKADRADVLKRENFVVPISVGIEVEKSDEGENIDTNIQTFSLLGTVKIQEIREIIEREVFRTQAKLSGAVITASSVVSLQIYPAFGQTVEFNFSFVSSSKRPISRA